MRESLENSTKILAKSLKYDAWYVICIQAYNIYKYIYIYIYICKCNHGLMIKNHHH